MGRNRASRDETAQEQKCPFDGRFCYLAARHARRPPQLIGEKPPVGDAVPIEPEAPRPPPPDPAGSSGRAARALPTGSAAAVLPSLRHYRGATPYQRSTVKAPNSRRTEGELGCIPTKTRPASPSLCNNCTFTGMRRPPQVTCCPEPSFSCRISYSFYVFAVAFFTSAHTHFVWGKSQ
jgi:hypothetical protein